MTMTPERLLLFDIDGTLIRSDGAGRAAMTRALEAEFRVPDGFRDVPMMGRTDPLIVSEIFEQNGLPVTTENLSRFQKSYYAILEEELGKPRENKRICSGILPLLDKLEADARICLGLLTGNWRKSAFLKLKHFGLDERFETGAFSDDAANREDLVPVAMNRFTDRFGKRPDPENVFIIGDTPLDIACGQPHGCTTVAVATGFHSFETLASASPDFLFRDFSRTEEVLPVFLKPNARREG